MRAIREMQDKAPACCLKKAQAKSSGATLSAPCCCKIQPVTDAPSAVGMLLAQENAPAVLSVCNIISAPNVVMIPLLNTTVEVTSPRGPPLSFASLRAPPVVF
jgi:hypothetical protein